MMRTLGTLAVIAVALLAIVPLAHGDEQTRETYKAQVEPICQANRIDNERIMDGARERINKNELKAVGKQFVRASDSFGQLVKQLATVPAPPADDRRVERWLEQMRLLKQRVRNVGKYYKVGAKIKAAHESILAERSGISANNISIVFHVHDCRFGHIA